MPIYGQGPGKIVEVGAKSMMRALGLATLALFLIIFLFNSVVKVPTGSVSVLTLFGRVTGETLPEGIHVINPLKATNEMSIRTQEIKESASVPSAEGLVMNLDTSLIHHGNPDKAVD